MTTEELNNQSAEVAASNGSDAGPDLSSEASTSPAQASTEESSPNADPQQNGVAPSTEAAPSEDAAGVDSAATAAETTEAAASDTSGAPAEGAEASTEGGSAEASADGEVKKKRRRRKKKKKEGEHGEHRSHERTPFHMGEEVFGKVTAVLDSAIMVDLSGKALALLDRSEMEADDLVPEVGERFVAQVLGDGARGGLVVLTRKRLAEDEAQDTAEQAAKDGFLINALVTGVIKGGVEVIYEALRAFAPASGVDLHPRTANFQNLVGQVLDFKVTSYEKQGREVILSRRPMLEKEAHERRKRAREVLKEDAEMQ